MSSEQDEPAFPGTSSEPSSHIGKWVRPEGSEESEGSKRVQKEIFSRRKTNDLVIKSDEQLNWSHIVDLLRHNTKYVEVTPEQIDRVRIMHDKFKDGAEFSFNYNTMLLVASILAGLGLVSNSSTTVIASMLVSPIMGPVVGIAYGITIQDWQLCKKSMFVELLSLFVCIIVGMIVSACTGWTTLAESWPTAEMESRALWPNFWVSFPVAFFSGFGVAVSLLDESTSSLVGVAISASLLPPAVNAGVLWIAWFFYMNDWLSKHRLTTIEVDGVLFNITGDNIVVGMEYQKKFFNSGGMISLGITLVNVALIIISSCMIFRMKERLPLRHKKVFWEDLGVARKIYKKQAFVKEVEEAVKRMSSMSNTSLAKYDTNTQYDPMSSLNSNTMPPIEEKEEQESTVDEFKPSETTGECTFHA